MDAGNKEYLEGNAEIVTEYFALKLKKADPKIVYFGDHIWSDVYSTSRFNTDLH